jgi:hypothetical protein
MAPALEAGVLRELCLVLLGLLNIARAPCRFFHAAAQHKLRLGASFALFSDQGRDPRPAGERGTQKPRGNLDVVGANLFARGAGRMNSARGNASTSRAVADALRELHA